MPPRSRRGRPVMRLATKSRVHRIVSKAKWTRAHRMAKGQMVFVLFAAEFGQNTPRLRQFVSDMSHQANFKDAHFLYVDVEKVPEVSEEYGITSEELPVFACFRNGQLLEKYPVDQKIEGVLAYAMSNMFNRHAASVAAETSEQGGRGMKLALQIIGGVLTIGAVAVGATVMFMFYNPTATWWGSGKLVRASSDSKSDQQRWRYGSADSFLSSDMDDEDEDQGETNEFAFSDDDDEEVYEDDDEYEDDF